MTQKKLTSVILFYEAMPSPQLRSRYLRYRFAASANSLVRRRLFLLHCHYDYCRSNIDLEAEEVRG